MRKTLLFICTATLFSCTKDKVSIEDTLNHRTFYCNVIHNSSNDNETASANYDYVLQPELINDSIFIQTNPNTTFGFPMSDFQNGYGVSERTLVGSVSTLSLSLEFKNGFHEMDYRINYNNNGFTGHSHTRYQGTLSHLSQTDPDIQEQFHLMTGLYTLDAFEKETYNNYEYSTSQTYDVDFSPHQNFPGILLNGSSRSMKNCYSYYQGTSNFSNNGHTTYTSLDILWLDNNLNYEYFNRSYNAQTFITDTTHYIYNGSKL